MAPNGTMGWTCGKDEFFGMVLGVGAGLLVDSALILWGGVSTLWLAILTLGILLIAPLVLCARAGIAAARRGWVRATGRARSILIAAVLWPACLVLPILLDGLAMRAKYSEIPIYPRSTEMRRRVSIFGTDGGPPFVELSFRTQADEKNVQSFYRGEFVRRGWKELEDGDVSLVRFGRRGATVIVRDIPEDHKPYLRFDVWYLTR